MTAAVDERSSVPGEVAPGSLPALLVKRAGERPKAVAMRVKELGRWREITWAQHLDRVKSIGHALLELGIGVGDRVAIVSETRPEWVAIDLAVQGIGATTVGLLTSLPEADLRALLRRSGARAVFVEDEEQHDKVMAVRAATQVERVIVLDTRGFRQITDPTMSLEALEAIGHADARNGLTDRTPWYDHVARLDPDAIATIVFTAGTTGEPKGVMFGHTALVASGQAAVDAFGVRLGDDQYSYLPLAEVTERLLTVAVATTAASVVHFGEGGESFLNDLREVQPTVLFGPPRVWERISATVDASIRRSGHLKRAVCRLAQRRGRKALDARRRGGNAHGPASVLAELLVTRPLRRRLGLARIRVALSGTAPALVGVLDDLWALGTPVREVYGVAETAGIGAVQPIDKVQPGTVGRAVASMEIKTGDGGIVMLRGATMFSGYLDSVDPTATGADPEGWFHTGDVGELDEDVELRIIGRGDDAVLTSTGNKVLPEPIEARLVASPYVRDAIVVGSGKPYVGAIIGIEAPAVREWAAARQLTFNTYADLVTRPEVRDLVQEHVDAVNANLTDPQQIVRFELLPVELTLDDGMLTATSKVRRTAVLQRFAEQVDRIYEEGSSQ